MKPDIPTCRSVRDLVVNLFTLTLFMSVFFWSLLPDVAHANTLANVTVTPDWSANSVAISGDCVPSSSPAPVITASLNVTTTTGAQTLTAFTTCSPLKKFQVSIPGLPAQTTRVSSLIEFGSNKASPGTQIRPLTFSLNLTAPGYVKVDRLGRLNVSGRMLNEVGGTISFSVGNVSIGSVQVGPNASFTFTSAGPVAPGATVTAKASTFIYPPFTVSAYQKPSPDRITTTLTPAWSLDRLSVTGTCRASDIPPYATTAQRSVLITGVGVSNSSKSVLALCDATTNSYSASLLVDPTAMSVSVTTTYWDSTETKTVARPNPFTLTNCVAYNSGICEQHLNTKGQLSLGITIGSYDLQGFRLTTEANKGVSLALNPKVLKANTALTATSGINLPVAEAGSMYTLATSTGLSPRQIKVFPYFVDAATISALTPNWGSNTLTISGTCRSVSRAASVSIVGAGLANSPTTVPCRNFTFAASIPIAPSATTVSVYAQYVGAKSETVTFSRGGATQGGEPPPQSTPITGSEVRPGILGTGNNRNSSRISLGEALELKWMLNLDTQVLDPHVLNSFNFGGSTRMKNLMLRDKTIALLTPGTGKTGFSLVDAETGTITRHLPVPRLKSSGGEYNPLGIEGRDVRMGQFVGYWHPDGFIYFRGAGDNQSYGKVRVSDGAYKVDKGGSPDADFANLMVGEANSSAYFSMAENSNWYLHPKGTHDDLNTTFKILHKDGAVSSGSPCSGSTPCPVWARASTMLMDGDWIYTLGTTTHPGLGWKGPLNPQGALTWLGVRVRGLKLGGQTPTSNNATATTKFDWKMTESIAVWQDGDLSTAVKPMALGKNDLFLITQSGVTWTPGTDWTAGANIDFSQPLVINALNRFDGSLRLWKKLSIRGESALPFSQNSNWRPQIAYTDRSAQDGNEYVVVMLPEAHTYQTFGEDPVFDPYDTPADSKTKLAVVNVTNGTEAWSYQYPHGGTTPIWHFHANTNTKMTVAGDAVYVAWVKTSEPLANYVDPTGVYDLTLYVDRFDLQSGAKSSFSFPLGVKGNTVMIDDVVAADGRLHVLLTYREWFKASTFGGGAQALITLGGKSSSNKPPVITAQASASSNVVELSDGRGVDLSISAIDPEQRSLRYVWNKFAGPGEVRFDEHTSGTSATSTATFSYPGIYVLECRVIDPDGGSATSKVTVTANPSATSVTVSNGAMVTYERSSSGGYIGISRSGPKQILSTPLEVAIQVGGTATPGVDYVMLPDTVIIPAGVSSVKLMIVPVADSELEGDETVEVTVKQNDSYQLAQNSPPYWKEVSLTRTVTIKDGATP